MRAAILRRYGPPEVVEVGTIPDPVAGPGELRVRVRASSLNPLDAKLRSGALRVVMPLRFPAVLGFDLAGEVESIGPGVTGWTVGERAYGRTSAATGGAHAEFAVVAASVLDRIPRTLGFEAAAALPLVAMTALQALRQARLREHERVLVIGAAGGVGSIALQVARALGADVSGIASRDAEPLLARLGARPVDRAAADLGAPASGYDVVLDTVSDAPGAAVRRALAARGRYVSTGFSPALLFRGALARLSPGRRFGYVMSRADGALLREVSTLVTAEKLTAVVDSTYPIGAIAEAHARLERGHLRGKIVIRID
jgi:NADPH:quinone reductase-like Zn-dependent oxidoreductase